MTMHEGLVCKESRTGGRTIAVPADAALREEILRLHHDTRLGGHLGPYRMIGALSSRYFWKGMQADVKAYVRKCPTCQANKVVTKKP